MTFQLYVSYRAQSFERIVDDSIYIYIYMYIYNLSRINLYDHRNEPKTKRKNV